MNINSNTAVPTTARNQSAASPTELTTQSNKFVLINLGGKDRRTAGRTQKPQKPLDSLEHDVLLNQTVERMGLTQVNQALFRMKIDGHQIVHKLRPFPPSANYYEKIEDPCVIQPEYRGSMQLGSSGIDLLASYYNRKFGANIVRKFKDKPLSIQHLPDVSHELFGEARCEPGPYRCAFLFEDDSEDDKQCVPVIYIKETNEFEFEFEAILVADSRGKCDGDPAQVLAKQFDRIGIDVYRVDTPRRRNKTPSDRASSYVDGVKFAATITGCLKDDYILPNMVPELSRRSRQSADPGSDRVFAVTLPFELAKLSQLNDFIATQREGVAEEDLPLASAKRQQFTRFSGEHLVTVQMDDGNGGSVPAQRIDWLRKKGLTDPERIHIEYYNQQLEAIYEDWTPEYQKQFARCMKDVRRGEPIPPVAYGVSPD